MEGMARERVVFSKDGARLAVCSLDGEVKVWDSATGTLSTRFTPEGARGVAVAAASWSRVSSDSYFLSDAGRERLTRSLVISFVLTPLAHPQT